GHSILVSVRVLELNNPFDPVTTGAILQIDLNSPANFKILVDNLYGPADIQAIPEGLIFLEQSAEQISFVSWKGQRRIIWDGLGLPRHFIPMSKDIFWVTENFPSSTVSIVTPSRIEAFPVDDLLNQNFISGIEKISGGVLVLQPETGNLILIDQNQSVKLFAEYFFADKILRAGENSV